jgi:hypothetical protein
MGELIKSNGSRDLKSKRKIQEKGLRGNIQGCEDLRMQ